MRELEILSEKHAFWFRNEIEWIRFGRNIDFVNEQSVDVDDLIIKTPDRILYLHCRECEEQHLDSSFLIAELEGYDEKEFPLCLHSTVDEPLRFVRLCYDEGELDTLKFTVGDRYLFIYGSDCYLVVLKSLLDLVDADGRPMPEEDDSVLFSSEALQKYLASVEPYGD